MAEQNKEKERCSGSSRIYSFIQESSSVQRNGIQEENKRIQRDNERKNPEDAAEKFKTRYRMKD